MKKQFLILGFLFITALAFSQSRVDSLVQKGIKFHDNGEYDMALETYKAALEIEPNSALVNYEIALTYMMIEDYENSIKHSDKVIAMDGDLLLQAYLTKASCLDYTGKTNESVKLFKRAIRKFGDHYLLYYNLGYTYYNLREYDKAVEALTKAININPEHASSHLLLGYLMSDKNQVVQSLLCLHYFLFLEPNSERAVTAYFLLQKQFGGNVEADKDKPNQINIFLDPDQAGTEFGAAAMMISMLEASRTLEENKGKSEEELFFNNTTSFFKILGELNSKKNKGLWWDYYVPFFYDIARSDHMETYCYYISLSSNVKAEVWLQENSDKIDLFDAWLRK